MLGKTLLLVALTTPVCHTFVFPSSSTLLLRQRVAHSANKLGGDRAEAPAAPAADVDTLVAAAESIIASSTEGAASSSEGEEGSSPPPVLAQSSAVRRTAREALTGALTRSLDRQKEANSLMRDGLAALRELLIAEIAAEEERLQSIEQLVNQLGTVVDGKAEIVERETAVLKSIQDLKAQTTEKVIRDRFEEAAAAKAELISIERVLSETMVSVKAQLESECGVAADRLKAVRSARAALPDPDDDDDEAVRRYGFGEIVDLQDSMLRMQQAVAESESEVSGLKQKIAAAMTQRNVLLGLQSKGQIEDEKVAAQAKAAEGAKKQMPGGGGGGSSSGGGGSGSSSGGSSRKKRRSGGADVNLEKLPPGTPRDLAGGLVALGGVGLNVRSSPIYS